MSCTAFPPKQKSKESQTNTLLDTLEKLKIQNQTCLCSSSFDNRMFSGGDEPEEEFILPSANNKIEQVLRWLRDDTYREIAIRGESGMGKTWIARQILRRAVAEKMFEACIWVGKPDMSDEHHPNMRTIWATLSKLVREKDFLIIIDDMATYKQIFYGFMPRKIYKYRRCPFLFILPSGHHDDDFGAVEGIQMESLSEGEAWLLFNKFVGKDLLSKIDCADVCRLFQPLLRQCEGVPFRIVDLTKSLRSFLSDSSSSSIFSLLSDFSKILKMSGKQPVKEPDVKHIRAAGDMPNDHFRNRFILPSTREDINTVWEWLQEDHYAHHSIIQADVGMGKSWITRHLIDRAVAANLFDICIWVGAKDTDEARIQILDQLNLSHDGDQKRNIYESLVDKYFLLVLDDYELYGNYHEDFGVPPRHHCVKSCKVLQLELSNKVQNYKVLKLKKFSEDEALLLFKKITGIELLVEIGSRYACEGIIQFLVRQCEGVPLKIINLAESFRNFSLESSYSSVQMRSKQLANSWNSLDNILYEMYVARWKTHVKEHATEPDKEDEMCIVSDDTPDGCLPSEYKNFVTLWSWIHDESVCSIAILGEAGVGKKWIARGLMNTVAAYDDSYISFWLDVQDTEAAQKQILGQLNLSNQGGCRSMIHDSLVGKTVLLIFDGIPSFDLEDVGFPYSEKRSRIIRVVITEGSIRGYDFDQILEIEKLSTNEAWLLFQNLAGNKLLSEMDSTNARCFLQPYLDHCSGLPLNIFTLVGMLKNLASESSSSSSNGQPLLAKFWKAHYPVLPKTLPGIKFICEMLPEKDMKVCFLFCSFFPRYCQFSSKQLITMWMKAGFLDGFDSLENAYEKGRSILKELMRHHFFNNIIFEDDDNVLMNVRTELVNEVFEYDPLSGIDVDFLVKCAIVGGTRFDIRPRQISLSSGNMDVRFLTSAHPDEEPLTFLLYGDKGSLLHAVPDEIFERMSNLEDVSFLHAGIITLPKSISKVTNLRVLVARGCELLQNVTQIKGLQHLGILCLSGCRSLKELPNDFFDGMESLENLDLSNTQLKKLPSSFSNLHNIQFLILSGCSNFETLPCMQEFYQLALLDLSGTLVEKLPAAQDLIELEYLVLRGCLQIETIPHPHAFPRLKLLDLSGARSFREFQGEFSSTTASSLLRLDLSDTQIAHVPPLSRCVKLREIILKNCPNLVTIPPFCAELEVLDLSGARLFENFQAKSLGDDLLNLDLSRTHIRVFPKLLGDTAHLVQLLLRNCEYLEELPELEFKRLQVLDLSGAVNFKNFKDNSFRKLCSLQTLNLSETQVAKLPILSECSHLQQITLRGCLKLEILPQVKTLTKLEVLDMFGATAFKQFQDDSFGDKEHFQELDLSGTQVIQIPMLSGCRNLCKLILGGCSQLETVPDIDALAKLQVLDISGVGCAIFLHDRSFENKYDLSILNFSGSQIVELPSLSNCTSLSRLLLPDCKKLVTVPSLKELTRLEVLDLSGDTSFAQFQHESLGSNCALQKLDLSGTILTEFSFFLMCKNLCELSLRGCSNLEMLSFDGMFNLQKLDLSGSAIEMLPPTVSELSNLRHLLLKDCSRLTFLPHLKELTKMEVLDLSGDTSFSQFQDDMLGNDCALQTLDLSGTKVTNFSVFSTCENLRQLSLRGCSNLETLSFEGLLDLRMLDLSESPIDMLPPSVLELQNLRQLFLRGCSNLRMLPHLENLAELKVLDLSGTSAEFPPGISKCIHLWYLGVTNRKFLWSFDWELTREITEQLSLEICDLDGFGNLCLHITVSSTDIFLFLQKKLELWGKCIEKFHFCLCSTEEWPRERDIYLQEKGFVFKEIYYQTNNIPQLTDEPDKFLKICGFQLFPDGIELVLSHVEVLYLKKNDFITRLSDVGASNIKVMRECWVERCNKIETLFHEEETEGNLALGRCLENLWISNLSKLKCLFGEAMPSGSFSCLKHMYIDCCPRLTSVFSSHLELNTLETLEIKFCDQLVSIFGDQTVSGEQTLPRLKMIILCKLPKLQSICRGVLPSLELLQVKGCPELQELPVSGNSSTFRSKIKE